jgi:hypothetical protein
MLYDPLNHNAFCFYGPLDGARTFIQDYDCFLSIKIDSNLFQHGDSFLNGNLFLFSTTLSNSKTEPTSRSVFGVLIALESFLELLTNDCELIGKY